ncbi:hypothetical protein SAMN06265795_10121 [Noviherbaspirillum humi]|uniref:Tetratricopeptide repeat-containing protein n=1 Tax=Noviherbaspirillum humi TaxID=1688639 RepID=A0A239BPW4_9BURK|nr:hypothetical protein [Noviherbaspirillum humi]SNS10125.1 hypothetical protein SAMN06265795_10121 [Noviherbaspirillum humi]
MPPQAATSRAAFPSEPLSARQADSAAAAISPPLLDIHERLAPAELAVRLETFAAALGMMPPEAAPQAMALAEQAMAQAAHVAPQLHDAGMPLGAALRRIGELHLHACLAAKPPPAALAERLFRLTLALPLADWHLDPAAYRRALGKAGLRPYVAMVEAEWERLAITGASHPGPRRQRLDALLRQLAQAGADVERLIALASRDLSASYRYLELAQLCQAAGRREEALTWAERGLDAFADHPDSRLADFLIDAYLASRDRGRALALAWRMFETYPTLQRYGELKRVATVLRSWRKTRQRALEWIETLALDLARRTSRRRQRYVSPNQSLRLEIALWEADLEGAWSAAMAGDCRRALLVALAGRLSPAMPERALELYTRIIADLAEEGGEAAYAEALLLLRRLEALMAARDREEEFEGYVTSLRIEYKRRRNFVRLLDTLPSPPNRERPSA